MIDDPLPPNLAVTEPLIWKLFPELVGDLPLLDRDHYQVRYVGALPLEIVGMLAGALVADYDWADRVSLIADSIYAILDRDALEGLPNVTWIERFNIGTSHIRGVLEWVTILWSATLTALYARAELFPMNRVYLSYEDNQGAFVPGREGRDGQGGQPVVNRWETSRAAQMLWGRPASIRFAAGGLPGRRRINSFE